MEMVGAIALKRVFESFCNKGSAPAAAPDIPEQIEKLGSLLEKGLINQEEYDEKKSDLLSRL